MTDEKNPKANSPQSGELLHPAAKVSFGRRLVNYFLTGLVIAGPIGITLYIAWSLIGFVDAFVKPLIPAQYNPDSYLPVHVPGFGLAVAVVFIMLLGFLGANLVGRSLVQMGERFFSRLPMISTLYSGLKQIFETVVTQSNKSFKQVGLIQYPRPGLWAVVFISKEAEGEVAALVDGDEPIMSCFLPTTPNPTSGFLLFVPASQVKMLDMSTEEAAKLIISAGLVSPEYTAATQKLAEKSGAAKAATTKTTMTKSTRAKRTATPRTSTKKPTAKKPATKTPATKKAEAK